MDTPRSAYRERVAREWLLGLALAGIALLPGAAAAAAAVGALWLWRQGWPTAALAALAVIALSRTVVAAHEPPPGRAVRPADEPGLAALVRDVAERLGFGEPLLVRVVPTVGASLGRVRVSGVRTHVLLIGLPLLRDLTEAQLASVIAHELGHRRHLASPRQALLRFSRALLADRLEGPFHLLARPAAPLLRASRSGLWHAETAADADAARIAGTEATTQALRRVLVLHCAFEALGDRWLTALAGEDAWPEDFYDALDAAVGDPHVARRAARTVAAQDALDPYATSDHPPLDRRVAALPAHPAGPYGAQPLVLRTGAAVEDWCRRQLAGLDDAPEPDAEPDRVRLLGLPDDRLRELGHDGRAALLAATGRDGSAEAVSDVVDALADGSWPRLARRLEPALRRVPAAVRPELARAALAACTASPFAEVLCSAGWSYTSRWLTAVVTSPDGRVVDLHELLDDALRTGDLEPVRTLWASAEPKEWAV